MATWRSSIHANVWNFTRSVISCLGEELFSKKSQVGISESFATKNDFCSFVNGKSNLKKCKHLKYSHQNPESAPADYN